MFKTLPYQPVRFKQKKITNEVFYFLFLTKCLKSGVSFHWERISIGSSHIPSAQESLAVSGHLPGQLTSPLGRLLVLKYLTTYGGTGKIHPIRV